MVNASHRRWIACAAVVAGAALTTLAVRPVGAGTAPTSATSAQGIDWAGTLLVQLRVADLDRAVKFYSETLGFELHWRTEDLQWAELKAPGLKGVKVGVGVHKEPGSKGVSMNFGVKDVAATRAALEARGVTFLGPTITIPDTVVLADFTDPDGNRIRIAQNLRAN